MSKDFSMVFMLSTMEINCLYFWSNIMTFEVHKNSKNNQAILTSMSGKDWRYLLLIPPL